MAGFVSLFALNMALVASAQEVNLPNIKNDFVLEPGKVEVFANPGETVTKSITVTNRAASKVYFKVEVEDFIGSDREDAPVVLLGDEKSPYSLKSQITPSVKTFGLESNQNITIPVKISIPANAQPGGFYASVLVSNQPSMDSVSNIKDTEGKTKLISRVGTLFFVRVNGTAKESGMLEDISVVSPSKESENVYKFKLLFKNDGNVHLVPYGWVTVTNIFGKVVGKVPVDAYFSLPQSLRYREVEWSAPFLFGKFTAEAQINRGYGSNLEDVKSVTFWVIPWKITTIYLAAFLVIFYAIRMFFKKFKLVAKQ